MFPTRTSEINSRAVYESARAEVPLEQSMVEQRFLLCSSVPNRVMSCVIPPNHPESSCIYTASFPPRSSCWSYPPYPWVLHFVWIPLAMSNYSRACPAMSKLRSMHAKPSRADSSRELCLLKYLARSCATLLEQSRDLRLSIVECPRAW